MKKLAQLLLFLYSSPVIAALSGSIAISGIVPIVVALIVTPSAGSNTLDLTTSQVNLQVADITEQSNNTLGYKVTLASSNAGLLKNGTSGSTAYTAKYNGVSVTLSVTPQLVTTVNSANSVTNVLKPFTISYTGQPSNTVLAGTYSDTLTFTIAAN